MVQLTGKTIALLPSPPFKKKETKKQNGRVAARAVGLRGRSGVFSQFFFFTLFFLLRVVACL
jgi:hypothetical protein